MGSSPRIQFPEYNTPKARALALQLTKFKIENARQPLALTLPMKPMGGIRHVPAGSSMNRLPQSMFNAKEV
jgi:hypothetical protein